MAKYGKTAGEKVKRALHERKRGKLKSGGSGKTVKSRKQAIAIGLSEAREAGAKVPPPKKSARKKSARKSAGRKSSSARKSSARKSSSRKSTARKTSSRKSTKKKSSSKK
jgi:hypothetical protein